MLFTIDASQVDENFLLISKEYKVLHYDEEPILFTGLTAYSYRVLVSLVEEDQDANGDWFARFFYTIIEPAAYADFLNRKITYLRILEEAKNVFVIDNHYKSKLFFAQKVNLTDIPANYLPTAESYCPTSSRKASLKYLVSMKGKLADNFQAVPSEVSTIQEAFSSLLTDSSKAMGSFWKKCEVYQSAYVPSSFQMSFEVVPILPSAQKAMFTNYEKVVEVYNRIINYCLGNLATEVESVFDTSGGVSYSNSFNELRKNFSDLYTNSSLRVPDDFDESLKKVFHKVLYDLENVTKNIGKNYDELNIFNRDATGEDFSLGELSIEDRDNIEDSVLVVESIENPVTVDSDYRDYVIHIYSLNTDSKRGMAIIQSQETLVSKPRIKITSQTSLEGSRFTASMHMGEYITVRAKGRWANGKCISLDVVDTE